MDIKNAKIALVFDWMTTNGGAEKVNLELHKMFPNAPIFSSIFNKNKFKGFEDAEIHTSFIQKLPFAQKKHQAYLPLMPYAFEKFDLSDFDIVISSSHSCAKGIITKTETMHVCYCHTPMRYAWDDWQKYISQYSSSGILKRIATKKMHEIRIWDRISSDRVDFYIANSSTVQKRIKKYYRRDSEIIHPMVTTNNFNIEKQQKGFFLALGRLIPYKKFDFLIDVFNELGLPLKIVGQGIAEKTLREKAKDNIEILGYLPDEEVKKLFSTCEAFIFPQIEDFGIVAIEAMASGRPVIAFKAGGALDSIVENKTGFFFEEYSTKGFQKALDQYYKHKNKLDPEAIRNHARTFDTSNFQKKVTDFVSQKWEIWQKEMR